MGFLLSRSSQGSGVWLSLPVSGARAEPAKVATNPPLRRFRVSGLGFREFHARKPYAQLEHTCFGSRYGKSLR